jgi:tetratricopeptide (TPR) repeat protein
VNQTQADSDHTVTLRNERSRLARALQDNPAAPEAARWDEFLPLLCDEAPDEAREALGRQLSRLAAKDLIMAPALTPSPPSLLPAFLLLPAAETDEKLSAVFRDAVRESLRAQVDQAAPGYLPAPSWCATVLRLAGGRTAVPSLAPSPGWMQWLDRRRTLIGTSLAAAAAASVLALALWTWVRPSPTVAAMETKAGLARQLYDQGRYEEAIPAYEQLFAGGRDHYRADFMIGNAYFRLGDYARAEKTYAIAVQRTPDFAPARMNRALALFHLGRLEEARRVYGDVIRVFGAAYPVMAERARTALTIINRREQLIAAGAFPIAETLQHLNE